MIYNISFSGITHLSFSEEADNADVLELAIDDASGLEFSLVPTNFSHLSKFLRIIYDFSLTRKISATTNKKEYEIWYEYEMLRRVERSGEYQKDKPDFMLEDLNEIKSRRDDIGIRIRSQLDHYEKVKNQVRHTKINILQFHESYFGPILSKYETYLMFESFGLDQLSYAMFLSDDVDGTDGTAVSELSFPFTDDIHSLYRQKKPLSIKTKRTETGNNVIKATIDDSWFHSLRIFQIVYSLYEMGLSQFAYHTIILTRIEAFDLLSLVKENYSKNEVFSVIFEHSSQFSLEYLGKTKGIKVQSPNVEMNLTTRMHGLGIISLIPLLSEIQELAFNITLPFLPNFINVVIEKSQLVISTRPIDTHMKYARLFISLLIFHGWIENLVVSDETYSLSEIVKGQYEGTIKIIKGNILDTSSYNFGKLDVFSEFEKEMAGIRLFPIASKYASIRKLPSSLSISMDLPQNNKTIHSKLDYSAGEFSHECTCGERAEFCRHILALIQVAIQEVVSDF